MTLALVTWISAIGTFRPQIVASVVWLENQGQQYACNRALDRVIVDATRRAALARADAGQLAQLDTDIATSIAKDEAWLAAHPGPKR